MRTQRRKSVSQTRGEAWNVNGLTHEPARTPDALLDVAQLCALRIATRDETNETLRAPTRSAPARAALRARSLGDTARPVNLRLTRGLRRIDRGVTTIPGRAVLLEDIALGRNDGRRCVGALRIDVGVSIWRLATLGAVR